MAGKNTGDSSPDLSLKLRRGSSDSRDSFYMDFAQGIDSDIEEVATTSGLHDNELMEMDDEDATIADSQPNLELVREEGWPGLPPGGRQTLNEPALLPSPASPSAVIVSPETLSHQSSPPRKPETGRVRTESYKHEASSERSAIESRFRSDGSSDDKTLLTLFSESFFPSPIPKTKFWEHFPFKNKDFCSWSMCPNRHIMAPYMFQPGHQMFQANFLKRPSRLEQLQVDWKRMGSDALASTLSALYGKLLVVMGIAFPMAEVISTYIPPSFYEGFYLYLYFGSMLFLLYMYVLMLKDRSAKTSSNSSIKRQNGLDSNSSSSDCSDTTQNPTDTEMSLGTEDNFRGYSKSLASSEANNQYRYGSFYLRMGAVAFGIGSMIYSGLEFGQYFELERDTKCHNVMLALTPATRMAFIFIQMYFIFLNDEQMKFFKHKLLARFGLMHMIGTNLSVWLNVLIQETKHEILTFYDPENGTLMLQHRHSNLVLFSSKYGHAKNISEGHHRVARGLKGPHHLYECRRTNIIGSLVQDASGFLFPCTIEYSLICAAILYVMWKNISKVTPRASPSTDLKKLGLPETHYRRSPHHYSVDCAGAHKGLFVGILILVLTIISLILFFVLISRPEFVSLAVMEVNICELTLYGLSTLATLVGMVQVRQLKFEVGRNLELDNILLIGAQTGMFLYSTFTIIGGHFTIEKHTVLVLITALASLLQTTCQTMFVLDAYRRSCVTLEQFRRKPGREIITFLLVTNLAMWAISTLEKSRAESHPIQLHFYGLWAWTIITHVSMPLAIFYRFHSTVCLCEIWKKAYKIKPTYM